MGPPPWYVASRPAPTPLCRPAWPQRALPSDATLSTAAQSRAGRAALRSLGPALGSLHLGDDMGTVQPRHSAGCSHLSPGPDWPHLRPTALVAPVGEGEGQAPHQALPDPHPGRAPPNHTFQGSLWCTERPSSGKFSPSLPVYPWDSDAAAPTRLQVPRAARVPRVLAEVRAQEILVRGRRERSDEVSGKVIKEVTLGHAAPLHPFPGSHLGKTPFAPGWPLAGSTLFYPQKPVLRGQLSEPSWGRDWTDVDGLPLVPGVRFKCDYGWCGLQGQPGGGTGLAARWPRGRGRAQSFGCCGGRPFLASWVLSCLSGGGSWARRTSAHCLPLPICVGQGWDAEAPGPLPEPIQWGHDEQGADLRSKSMEGGEGVEKDHEPQLLPRSFREVSRASVAYSGNCSGTSLCSASSPNQV